MQIPKENSGCGAMKGALTNDREQIWNLVNGRCLALNQGQMMQDCRIHGDPTFDAEWSWQSWEASTSEKSYTSSSFIICCVSFAALANTKVN